MRRVTALMVISVLAVPGLVAAGANAPAVAAGRAGGDAAGNAGTAATASRGDGASGGARFLAGVGQVKLVRYAGYTVEVPASWPVYRLDSDPYQCVRYDQHAVYLGTPGAYQECPAHLVGRTGTVSLQLGGTAPWPGGGWQTAMRVAGTSATVLQQPQEGELQADFARRLTVTGTYGDDGAIVERVIGTVRLGGHPAAVPSPTVPAPAGTAAGETMASGSVLVSSKAHKKDASDGEAKGFDACAAPSLHAMRRWYPRFSAAGIYLGGPEAACGWGNLSPHWVEKTTELGWELMPTYVGPQAPCTSFQVKINPAHAEAEGRTAATDAISLAQQLGLRRGPIYDDMEAYAGGGRCRRPVLAFLDGWTRELHDHGYRSGVYSSVEAAVMALGMHSRVYGHPIAKPDSVWFALWNNQANLVGLPYLQEEWWGAAGERIKQWMGGHPRWYDGVRLDIDSDVVAGAVYRTR